MDRANAAGLNDFGVSQSISEVRCGAKRNLAATDWPTMQHYAEAKTDIVEAILYLEMLRSQERAFGPENWFELLHKIVARASDASLEMHRRPFRHGCPQ